MEVNGVEVEVEVEAEAEAEAEASSIDHKPPPPADIRGRHRILAELKRLEQEERFLEEELEELERTERVSASLQELLLQVESKPDPLLPVTNGPTDPFWDQWFEGPQDPPGCRCWMLRF